jgi:hypothetical protein
MTALDGLEDAGFHVLEAKSADADLKLLVDHSEDVEGLSRMSGCGAPWTVSL